MSHRKWKPTGPQKRNNGSESKSSLNGTNHFRDQHRSHLALRAAQTFHQTPFVRQKHFQNEHH